MVQFAGVKLLISDMDGTLLTRDKRLTEATREAVLELRRKGIRFAITSGRPPRGMAMLIPPLGIEEPIAGFNGGAYVRPDLTILKTHPLARDVASLALARIAERSLDVWVYSGNEWYVRNPDGAHVRREMGTVQFAPSVANDFAPLLGAVEKIVGVSDDYPLVQAADEHMRAMLGSRASVSRSQPYYLDITHSLANKAAVVDYHAARLGLSHDDICTIGDGPNDILMFGRSGHSIAMGNAPADVKSRAQAVTDTCDSEGFAKAVDRYLLH